MGTNENGIIEKTEDKKYGIGFIGYGTGKGLDVNPRDFLGFWKKQFKKGKINEEDMIGYLDVANQEYRGLEKQEKNKTPDTYNSVLIECNDVITETIKLETKVRKKTRRILRRLPKAEPGLKTEPYAKEEITEPETPPAEESVKSEIPAPEEIAGPEKPATEKPPAQEPSAE